MTPYTLALVFVAFFAFAMLVARLDARVEARWAEEDAAR